MPHSTLEESQRRGSSINRATAFKLSNDILSMEKFPDHTDGFVSQPEGRSPSPRKVNSQLNGFTPTDRWQPRRESVSELAQWSGRGIGGRSHGRQKSLSDAFRTIRTRRGSVSANAHEIAEALKAPVSPKLIVHNLRSKFAARADACVDTLHRVVFFLRSY
jgi:solute carrier family 35, member E1